MANDFSDWKIAERFKSVSPYYETVSKRVSEMDDNVSDTLRCVINDCEHYSLGLDERIDITDICQLMIFVRKIERILKQSKSSWNYNL
jgi:phosphate uptake regulator